MKLKQTILNLLKLAFAISLLVSFIGCTAKTPATLTGDIASNPMVFFIENRTNVSNSGNLELLGANGVTTAEIDGKHYLFVTGANDDGVSMFNIASDGTVMNTTNVSNGGNLELDGAFGVTTAKVDGKHYFFVTGFFDNGFSVFRIADDGTVMNTTNVSDGGSLELGGASRITTAEVGGTTYLFVTGFYDDGFSVFRIADDGTVMNTANVSDDGDLLLSGANGVTTTEVGGTTYLFVIGRDANGFSMFRIANDGTLMNTTNVSDSGDLLLNGAIGGTTAEVGETTYLFVTGRNANGFSMFRIANDGTVMNTTNVSNGGALKLERANEVTAAEIDGKHYLFVTGRDASGFSVFNVANDGTLMNTTNVSDGGDLELEQASGVTAAEIGGKHYLFVTGRSDDGFSVFEFGLRPGSSP